MLPPPTPQADSVAIVHAFWDEVWNAHDPDAVDRFVIDDFIIVNAGNEIRGRENFKNWIATFLAQVTDLHLDVAESFQNHDGSRVASRWLITGTNNGILNTRADHQPIQFTGTAIWAVRADGKLVCNWVERATWELSQRLTNRL